MTPQEYCRQKTAQSGSSFYYSFLFLPPTQRDAIMALYAFCRAVDDVVDNAKDPSVAASKLAWWRAEIDRMDLAEPINPPTHPIALALQAPAKTFVLKAVSLKEIISGMEMDLHQHSYMDDEALSVYCWRVAGVVGVLSAKIFTGDNATSKTQDTEDLNHYASHMGQALQRINIIRDVGEDALRGRVYLPADLLKAHHLSTQDVLNRHPSDAVKHKLTEVLQASAAQARTHLKIALEHLPSSQIKAQRAGLIMGRVYASLLVEIERSGFAVMNQRVSLTPLRKFSLAWRTWVAPHRAVRALADLANDTTNDLVKPNH